MRRESLNREEPIDDKSVFFTNLRIIDKREMIIGGPTTTCTISEEKTNNDLNTQTQLQQMLFNLDIDSDDYSDGHHDDADDKIHSGDITDSNDDNEDDSGDEKEFDSFDDKVNELTRDKKIKSAPENNEVNRNLERNVDLDSDDYSDGHHDDADDKIHSADITNSDDDCEDDSGDEKEFDSFDDGVNELTRHKKIKSTSENNVMNRNLERKIVQKHLHENSNMRRESSNREEPVDDKSFFFTNLHIVDNKETIIRGPTTTCTKSEEENFIDLNIQIRLQQMLFNLDIDCDGHRDDADVEMHRVDITDSDDDSEDDSGDEKEFNSFDNSEFSKILDKFMLSDCEDIDLDAKIEKNVRKTMYYFSRKFIMDAIAEEREIEMEKQTSFISRIAGVDSEKYTKFEKRFVDINSLLADETRNSFKKFKEQMSNIDDTNITKSNVSDLAKVVKKGDIDYFKILINNTNKDNTIIVCKTLIDVVFLSCEYNEVHILDFVLKELLKCEEIHRKHLAFNHALYMNDVDLLEKIYYYYSGNLHWLGTEAGNINNYQENIVWNLKLLNIFLSNARSNSPDFSKETLFYLDSLINFNSFQVTLYTNLVLSKKCFMNLDQDSHKIETQIEALKDVVFNILKIYKFYMNKKEIKEVHIQVPLWMRDVLNNNALNFNFVDNLVREVYFKRIDLNVCLVLLDNINLLEERLLMPNGLYKNVKSRLYHFIYHLNKDWSDFMPDKSKKTLKMPFKIDSGQFDEMSYDINLTKLSISPLIYLERQEFHSCLNNFKEELEKIDIKSNIREKSNKISSDAHSLNIVPYVTDEVSLEKMLYYIDGLSYVDLKKERKNGQLIILRIIQILGEFIKDSEESAHLSQETEFFLQTKVPPSTMKILKKIRNNITHADAAQLVNKIDLEQNEKKNEKLFGDVLNELKEIKLRITEFLEIHKLRARRASVKDALNLLQKRLNNVVNSKNESQPNVHEIEENGYFKQIWKNNRSSEQYVEEVRFLETNKEFLMINLKETTKYLKRHVLQKLTFYLQKVQKALQYINKSERNSAVNSDEYVQWGIIREILRFLVEDADMFENHPWEVKKGRCLSLFKSIITSDPNKESIDNVNNIMVMLIESAEMYGFDKLSLDTKILSDSETTYPGLAKLKESLYRSNFMTVREQKAVLSNIVKIMESCERLKDQTNTNKPISKKEYDILLKNLTLKSQSEKHLSNLLLGRQRSLVLLECLSDRVSLLEEVLNSHCEDDNKKHLIFLKNQKYRLIVEALLLDIMNIFYDNNQKTSLKKTSKFLAEVNLRNVLSHGNPLLELAGDVIDATDLPMELMTRALRYTRDKESIKALTVLIRQNVDPNDIRQEGKTLGKDVQNLIREFKKSQRWQEYLLLAFKDFNEANMNSINVIKEANLSNQKTEKTKFKKDIIPKIVAENELLKATKKGDLVEIKRLVKTVANINATDASGKGCLHYAAMKGRADIIELLVQGSTDVRCKQDGRSALHYAAMNGHAAAARALLAAGADVTVADKRGKTPRDYAVGEVMRTILGTDKGV